ncbi:ribokinase [Meridianimarinicoccus roseus]|uniref:Ribokinase n=1 Tax=Meridianimarinicoccus roseus TaxID=2072018 RepID=A0A2V2LPQ8_9RHOB|nr:ribokinase [Meridianimarinicoccus roseus]PWR03613.1 ribokinase [Meridianimarinicoccus roseus]
MSAPVVILGVFVADTAFRADRLPRHGETILGREFALGPGGKGSNQAVAAARAGADARMLTRLGDDAFAGMAREIWAGAGVTDHAIVQSEGYTGAAFIFLEHTTGQNAIIVCPGVAADLSVADIAQWGPVIDGAGVVMTQLEQPMAAAEAFLARGRAAGAVTILNPAPAADLPPGMLALCDYVTPNESEAEGLTGIAVHGLDDARRAADALVAQGAGAAIITLGENGALLHGPGVSAHVPVVPAGPVVETTGAGDALNGAFAAALAEGRSPEEALRFGVTAASLSVTRPGAANSMARREEIEGLLAR